MKFSVQIQVGADSAAPALRRLVKSAEPGRAVAALREPLLELVRSHYESLPPNKMGAPSTGFWRSAADATYAVESGNALAITTYKIGVRQRFYGGTIHASRAKNLSITACVETYGKLPREFVDLVVIPFGRGQDAPKALVKVSDENDGSYKIMFWLTPIARQHPNPAVLPSDDEIFSTIDESLKALL